MSSRVIAAERIGEIEPFRMDRIGSQKAVRGTRRLNPSIRHDPETVRAEAYEAGRQAGIDEGLRQAQEQQSALMRQGVLSLRERIERLCRDFGASLDEIDRDVARELTEVSIEMARQVVRTHVSAMPDAVMAPLREGLAELLADARRVTVRIAPQDEGLVREALQQMLAEQRCDIRIDTDLEPGGCRLDSSIASIDASMQARWRHVLTAIGHSDFSPLGSTGIRDDADE